jgi:hypothetical protein
MPSEGRRRGGLGFPNSQLVDNNLDEVAQGLAEGTISRGSAIKLGGAALLGSMGLLSLSASKAGAQVTVQGLCTGKPAISNTRCPRQNSFCGVCQSCQCAKTVSGTKRCLDFSGLSCPTTDECDTNRDCSGNKVCVQVAACCEGSKRNLCVRPCPTNPDNCPRA